VNFLIHDRVGLGPENPAANPLAQRGRYPTLERLLDGCLPLAPTGRLSTAQAELVPVDARMGVPGRPQSATGQAAILTGVNAPARLGEHYGPRPDARVRALINAGTLFSWLRAAGHSTWFINAYPQRYFDAISSGKRLLSAIPYAVTQAGQTLPNYGDLAAGRALSADFTGEGWRSELGYTDAPVYTAAEAGRALARIAEPHAFTFFEHWLTDVLGHDQALDRAVENFVRFDAVLGALLESVDLAETLVVVGSDHGNVEECNHSRHTENPALGLLLGADRRRSADRLHALSDFAPIILDFLASAA
jgi:hypothetical protein